MAESPIQAGRQAALDPRWRAEAERVQEAALPPGRVSANAGAEGRMSEGNVVLQSSGLT